MITFLIALTLEPLIITRGLKLIEPGQDFRIVSTMTIKPKFPFKLLLL